MADVWRSGALPALAAVILARSGQCQVEALGGDEGRLNRAAHVPIMTTWDRHGSDSSFAPTATALPCLHVVVGVGKFARSQRVMVGFGGETFEQSGLRRKLICGKRGEISSTR